MYCKLNAVLLVGPFFKGAEFEVLLECVLEVKLKSIYFICTEKGVLFA